MREVLPTVTVVVTSLLGVFGSVATPRHGILTLAPHVPVHDTHANEKESDKTT